VLTLSPNTSSPSPAAVELAVDVLMDVASAYDNGTLRWHQGSFTKLPTRGRKPLAYCVLGALREAPGIGLLPMIYGRTMAWTALWDINPEDDRAVGRQALSLARDALAHVVSDGQTFGLEEVSRVIANWNDTQGRKKKEVIEALREAAERLKTSKDMNVESDHEH
jgi:hypothetical protein